MQWNQKFFKKGELIFSEGDAGTSAYIIDRGRVEIFVSQKNGKNVISTLSNGEIFGEMAIIDGSNRSASAVAVEDTELILVSKDQLIERIKLADPTVSFLVTILLNRVRNSLKNLSKRNMSTGSLPQNAAVNKEEEVAFIEKMKFENELLSALKNDQFTMYLQPIVSIHDESIVGFESLIRWNSPTRGFVRPDLFMGVAEETSLIIPIGQWVIKRTLREFGKVLREVGNTPLFVSINVSGKQLDDPEFFNTLEAALQQENIKAKQVKLEVTESILVEGDIVVNWLMECKKRGLTVALDDFGTGYSSLSYLCKLQFDNIKIDKSFTQSIADEKSYMIVKAIIDMAKGLRVPIIAEGIETVEQYQALRFLGCDFGQGYLYSKPVSVDDAITLLKNYKKTA
ncbi:MAG: EAL domain-containing protein [Bdellovibrionales bacterium]|nr:EAL domain-containing protein [Bdellovibrionales bacterium]